VRPEELKKHGKWKRENGKGVSRASEKKKEDQRFSIQFSQEAGENLELPRT